jgi:hypothetical protein
MPIASLPLAAIHGKQKVPSNRSPVMLPTQVQLPRGIQDKIYG